MSPAKAEAAYKPNNNRKDFGKKWADEGATWRHNWIEQRCSVYMENKWEQQQRGRTWLFSQRPYVRKD